MSRVLKQLKAKQQSFAVSPFVTFLQDSYFTPRMRLGFLPCLAPFVMGFADFARALDGGEGVDAPRANPASNRHWELYVKDLQTLEFEVAQDFAGALRLLWGEEASGARWVLVELVDLVTRVSPLQRQVVRLALQAVGSVVERAVEQIARDLEACTGKQLASLEGLRAPAMADAWGIGSVELDMPPEAEFEAQQAVEEVFDLFTRLGDQLLEHVQRKLEAENEPLGWEQTSSLTFHEFGSSRLRALCEAVGYEREEVETVQRFFTVMSGRWGSQRFGSGPRWLSDITDDHTPYEFSMALEGSKPEVRFLIEAQNEPTTLKSSWEDGLALNERLHQEFGVPLERFNRVKDLFEPRNAEARFSLWHAFGLKAGGVPGVKAYLNPMARGDAHAHELVQEALARLGFANAWRFISEVAMRRGRKDQLIYFSLDLSAHRAARIKIYIAHQDATADDVEAIMSQTKEYVPGEACAYYRKMLGCDGGFPVPRSTQTCLAFTSDDDVSPYHVTLYVPVRCYAKHDQEGLERIRSVLEPSRYAVLERAVTALARRPLDAGVGLIQWASMRREAGKMRMTFYLASEGYSTSAPHRVTPEAPRFLPTESAAEFNRVMPTT